jgi:hypothetical protein
MNHNDPNARISPKGEAMEPETHADEPKREQRPADRPHPRPDRESSMYELEFPTPQLSSPTGQGPVLVHGLQGYTDAGYAVRLATGHLRDALETELVASFDVDELLDYRSRRPTMTFRADHFADYTEPELNLWALRDTAGTPFLLLSGMEPDLRWERFTTAVRLLAEQLGVQRSIGLSAIPMAVPHTRPLGVTAHSSERSLLPADHTQWSGEIQVPSSASSLLEYRMAQHGHQALGFSVHVPHYLSQTEYPEAAQKLLELIGENAGLQLPLVALGEAAARVREQVDAHVEGNDEVQTVVTALERQYDLFVTAQERQAGLLAAEAELPSGDEIGAEFERFLAEQTGREDTLGDE